MGCEPFEVLADFASIGRTPRDSGAAATIHQEEQQQQQQQQQHARRVKREVEDRPIEVKKI